MSRKAPPLESFAPELKTAWQKAALEQIRIRVPGRSQATSLRHRLYKLRVALKEAGDPLYQTAQYGTIRIEPDEVVSPTTGNIIANGTWWVVLEPADSIFKDAFKEAGISADDDVPPLDLEL